MTRVALLCVALLAVAANATSFHAHYQRQTDPLQSIPDLRALGLCLNECAAVGEAQARQVFGELSTACTAALASQVGHCMQCIGKSPLTVLLTNDIKQRIQAAKTTYESQCAAAGLPITIDIGSAFNTGSSTAATPASTAAASTTSPAPASAAVSTPSAALSSTGSVSTPVSSTGAGYVHAPSFAIAAAAAIAVFAAI